MSSDVASLRDGIAVIEQRSEVIKKEFDEEKNKLADLRMKQALLEEKLNSMDSEIGNSEKEIVAVDKTRANNLKKESESMKKVFEVKRATLTTEAQMSSSISKQLKKTMKIVTDCKSAVTKSSYLTITKVMKNEVSAVQDMYKEAERLWKELSDLHADELKTNSTYGKYLCIHDGETKRCVTKKQSKYTYDFMRSSAA